MRLLRNAFLWTLLILVGGGALVLAFVKMQYGMGRRYPDLGVDEPGGRARLERITSLDYPPGNLAVAPNGHVIFNYHPLARTKRFTPATVFEWADGRTRPFPSPDAQKIFQGTFGMTLDRQNRIWFIEPASFDFQHTRLRAFDLTSGRQVEAFEFPGHAAQFAQDLRVTADGKYVLLADPGIFRFTAPQLIVYSVADHSFRTALGDHPCTRPEDWLIQTPFGPHRLAGGLINFTVGLDGIEISNDQKWVYIAAMTNAHLCRAPLAAVLDPSLKPADVARQVEVVGPKPMSDGITVDNSGRIILTDVEHGGLMAFDPVSRRLSTLVRSKDIIWADGVVTGPDGSIYFTDSAIPAHITALAGPPTLARLAAHRPYAIYRLKPQAPSNGDRAP